METFGDNLRRIRKLKGLTLQDLEEATGISAGQLSGYELGKTKSPSYDRVLVIAKALGVPTGQLTGEQPIPGWDSRARVIDALHRGAETQAATDPDYADALRALSYDLTMSEEAWISYLRTRQQLEQLERENAAKADHRETGDTAANRPPIGGRSPGELQ